jgi:acyl-coenzyme A thioesterase 13
MTSQTVPAGFVPYPYPPTTYFRTLGELYLREQGDGLCVLGLRLGEAHCNRLGIPHGGMLATLADGALGVNLHRARGPHAPAIVTVNLSLDYFASARMGDWLEAHVVPRRLGRQLAFGDCTLRVGEREVLRATGVFASVGQQPSAIGSDG